MDNPALPKLLEAEANLSNREAVLTAQLTTVREQRKGLQTVIEMFNAGEISEDAVSVGGASPALATPEASATPSPDAAESIPEMAPEAVTDPITFETVAPEPAPEPDTKTKRPTSRKRGGRPAKKAQPKSRKTGKSRSSASNWQKYIRKTFKTQPLPEVVATVLQSQPNSVFEIAEVMDAIFTENIPKSDFLKARNRISNILSAGARNGTWYRGRQGKYSLSDNAVKAS
ncbi:hypothetical protein IQ241_02640 [Romeria aff. gracilis LEGE 07310]|uniref:Uncharacterized protein n=1 Tax=Vasconcelosia minhoensis LEGE 07310 TaxID=915328 RepID=A0A8J7A4N4_9CYAN|nr:hypothetical protein [Romeria gracilis]MBE9076202.1 hypothetical protein [Romeria aff. gracilis LEGE 07310]